MNPQETRERAEQEAADQAEEERVALEDLRWEKEPDPRLKARAIYLSGSEDLPPWLFADERSQRRTEAMAREEGPWDDYSPWENEQLFR